MSFDGIGIDQEFLKSGMSLDMAGLNNTGALLNQMSGEHGQQINSLFEKEMNDLGGPVNFSLWTKMIQMQEEFNDRVSPGWKNDKNQEKYDYWMAILDETMEVQGSKHWKWWKDSEKMNVIDWDNVNVEFVDIFHFLLSISLQINHQDTIFMTMIAFEKMLDDKKISIRDEKFFDGFWQEFLMAVWQKSLPLSVVKWCEYFYMSGGNFHSLTRDYFIKNSLNHIRQEFGYNIGKYSKMWRDPSNPTRKVEDNMAANFLLKEAWVDRNLTTNSFEEMQVILRKYYLEYVSV